MKDRMGASTRVCGEANETCLAATHPKGDKWLSCLALCNTLPCVTPCLPRYGALPNTAMPNTFLAQAYASWGPARMFFEWRIVLILLASAQAHPMGAHVRQSKQKLIGRHQLKTTRLF